MEFFKRKFYDFFFRGYLQSKLSTEEKRKRYFIFIMAIITIPSVLSFGIFHFFQGAIQNSLPDLFIGLSLIITVMFLKNSVDGKLAYRIFAASITSLFIYNITLNLYGGGDIVWFYIYPFFTFFILGVFEGLFWVVFTMAAAFIIILFPELTHSFKYPIEIKIRLLISLTIISFVAWLLESLRINFYTQLMKQRNELKKALDEIKTLRGMFPICSHCKKIRDDKGYWNQIDSYLRKHSEAEFTHSICPDCQTKYYSYLDDDK